MSEKNEVVLFFPFYEAVVFVGNSRPVEWKEYWQLTAFISVIWAMSVVYTEF